MFECLVIDWLMEASTAAVAKRLRCSWHQIDGVRERAVARGLARRDAENSKIVEHLAVDETSFQKRHEYVTIVTDAAAGRVLYVADGRDNEALDGFFWDLPLAHVLGIKSVSMDMWRPYIDVVQGHVEDADAKTCFDRFHVAAYFTKGVNDVRKAEHRELRASGDDRLAKTRYLWLNNEENLSQSQQVRFEELKDQGLQVDEAWAMKETARGLWAYKTPGWARRAW